MSNMLLEAKEIHTYYGASHILHGIDFNIREGDQLSISIEGSSIVLQKLENTCIFCGSTDAVMSFRGKGLCATCKSHLSE